jgi:hypothetical protein
MELNSLYLDPAILDYKLARIQYKSHRGVFDINTRHLKARIRERALSQVERSAEERKAAATALAKHRATELGRRRAAQKIEQELEDTVRRLGSVLVGGAGLDRTGQDTAYLTNKRTSGSLPALNQ